MRKTAFWTCVVAVAALCWGSWSVSAAGFDAGNLDIRMSASEVAEFFDALQLVGARGVAPTQGDAAMVAHGYTDTPFIPGSKWRVHDARRPQPPVIEPGESPTLGAEPPSDAVVLFDGSNLKQWKSSKGGAAKWKVKDGYMEVVPESGHVVSKKKFGDCQLHVEWAAPTPPSGNGQSRGNSGVFLMGAYEFQVLDCYKNRTYADGMTGSIYGQYPPLVNACRKPGEWQTYDIIWDAPTFKNGKLQKPAKATVFLNGVLVQHARELLGRTTHKRKPHYKPHPPKGPIMLQDHKNPVRFRNIWCRPLGERAKAPKKK